MAARVRAHAEEAGARAAWVRRENLHVSLKFLGNVERAKLDAIVDALREIARSHRPFEVEVDGVGSFPPHGKPRVLFARVTKGAEPLAAIWREVEDALARQGFAREDKPFRAHVTFARVKQPKAFARMVPRSLAPVGTARIGSLTLFTSELTPSGSVYRVVADLPLE